MDSLSKQLDICLPSLTGKIVYLDYPVHENVGDLLIWMGAQEFLRRSNIKPLGQYSINNMGPAALAHMNACDTICFHGGGNLGDIWPIYQKQRETIITAYKHKRIVIMPQSVHFSDESELRKACAVFKAHPDLHIFLRDRQSLAILEGQGVLNLKLSPDMAHALWGKIPAHKGSNQAPLYLIRRDKEAASLPADVASASSTDWDDFITGMTEKLYRFSTRITVADGGKGRNKLPATAIWKAMAKFLIHRAVQMFAPHKIIITNRLHAMILSALMQKKCIAYDNFYGKLSTYAECWLDGVPDIEIRRL